MKSQTIYISCAENLTFIFYRIFVKLAGYQDGIWYLMVSKLFPIPSIYVAIKSFVKCDPLLVN